MFFRYYLGLAKQASVSDTCATMPNRLQWLFTPHGHRFLVSNNFTYGEDLNTSLFNSSAHKTDPLEYVMRVYIFCTQFK